MVWPSSEVSMCVSVCMFFRAASYRVYMEIYILRYEHVTRYRENFEKKVLQ